MKTFLFISLICAAAFADNSPFTHCSQATGDVSYLNCKIEVMNVLIKEEHGTAGLRKVNKLAEKQCVRRGINLDPKLALLSALDCQLRFKVDFYNDPQEL